MSSFSIDSLPDAGPDASVLAIPPIPNDRSKPPEPVQRFVFATTVAQPGVGVGDGFGVGFAETVGTLGGFLSVAFCANVSVTRLKQIKFPVIVYTANCFRFDLLIIFTFTLPKFTIETLH